jgi:predicted nucleotidyltransferase
MLRTKREDILRIAGRYGAHHVRVFGSFANGRPGPESDVDFLVELEPNRSLLDLSHLVLDLQDLLQRKVDVVEPDGIHDYIREAVLREAIPL